MIGMPPWLELRAASAAAAMGDKEEGHPLSRSEASARHPSESLPRAQVVMATGTHATLSRRLPIQAAVTHTDREKPRCAGLSKCAREDSNLHGPYSPQGPQPWTGRVDASKGVRIVQTARFRGRNGRIGRHGCCHGCCHGAGRKRGYDHHVTSAEIIQEIGVRLARVAPRDSRVVLFGSHARGQADEGSDYDILVIEPEVVDAARESVRLRTELGDLLVPIDVVVIDRERARRRASVRGTMVERALREGRVLADT